MMPSVTGITARSNDGFQQLRPSTALSTEIAGVISASQWEQRGAEHRERQRGRSGIAATEAALCTSASNDRIPALATVVGAQHQHHVLPA